MNIEFSNKLMLQVQHALTEDVGKKDVTASLIPTQNTLSFQLICREECTLCGTDWFDESFKQCDPDCTISWSAKDGDLISANSVICHISGNAQKLLTAERTALNFLQTLSGTATATQSYVKLIKHTQCQLLDTRKTIPLLRDAQKYAVTCGGGTNHRHGLYDAFLIKENHIASSNSISEAVSHARDSHPELLLEVEVETFEQLDEAINASVDRVLLDNFSIEELKKAVEMNNHRIQLEASGDITKNTIAKVAETGVDFISTGAITKHLRAVDFSLRFM